MQLSDLVRLVLDYCSDTQKEQLAKILMDIRRQANHIPEPDKFTLRVQQHKLVP